MGSLSAEDHYLQILINNGITDKVSKVEILVPDLAGEHFSSVCESVTIQFQDKPQDQNLHFFVKKMLPTTEAAQTKMYNGMMLKEGFFLTKFIQDLKDLCVRKLGKDNKLAEEVEEIFPKAYHADKDSIVLEDISKRGYIMLDKSTKQGLAETKLVLDCLAKLHAVSHALIMENGGEAKYLELNPLLHPVMMTPESSSVMCPMMNGFDDGLNEMLLESSVAGSVEYQEKMKKYRGKWFETELEVLGKKSILPTVNHGDCWNNNQMFRWGANCGKLKGLILLDLQNACVNSPAADLLYYLFTSPTPEVRKQWKVLIQDYFKTFEEIVQRLGLRLSVTFEDFLLEFRRLSKVGMISGAVMIVGQEAFKVHDAESSGSVFDGVGELIKRFVSENKDKAEDIVARVIDVLRDYEDISSPSIF